MSLLPPLPFLFDAIVSNSLLFLLIRLLLLLFVGLYSYCCSSDVWHSSDAPHLSVHTLWQDNAVLVVVGVGVSVLVASIRFLSTDDYE